MQYALDSCIKSEVITALCTIHYPAHIEDENVRRHEQTCETETSVQQLMALHEMTNDQTEVMITITARAAKLASIAVVTRPYQTCTWSCIAYRGADISLHVNSCHRE